MININQALGELFLAHYRRALSLSFSQLIGSVAVSLDGLFAI